MRRGVDQRHRILNLIAEPEGAPRLVVSAPRPETARQRLIQEPSIGQHVERLDRVSPHARPRAHASSVATPFRALLAPPQIPGNDAPGVWHHRRRRPTPSRKMISRSCPSASSKGTWMAAQGSKRGPHFPGKPCDRLIAAGFRSVPLRPRNSVRSPLIAPSRIIHVEKGRSGRETPFVWISRE